MLECRKIDAIYRVGEVTIQPLVGIGLKIRHGSVALMGPSGSGKSTLLRVIAGLQKPDSGQVCIDGTPVHHDAKDPEMDGRVSLVHQDHRLVSFLDVGDNLQIARRFKGLPAASREEIQAVLERVGLSGCAGRAPATLSGGEQQRVAVARTLLLGARVVLADEPTGALDRENSLAIAELLRDLAEESGAVVIAATHDHDVAARLDQTLQLLDLGGSR